MSRADVIKVIINDIINCDHVDYDLALRHDIEISEIWENDEIIGLAVEDDVIYSIQDMDKVILTPHIAWGSIEARQRCVNEVYENILSFLKGEERNIVNNE